MYVCMICGILSRLPLFELERCMTVGQQPVCLVIEAESTPCLSTDAQQQWAFVLLSAVGSVYYDWTGHCVSTTSCLGTFLTAHSGRLIGSG
jgi:hypothetical protein